MRHVILCHIICLTALFVVLPLAFLVAVCHAPFGVVGELFKANNKQ